MIKLSIKVFIDIIILDKSIKFLLIGGMKSDLYHRQLFSNLKGRG